MDSARGIFAIADQDGSDIREKSYFVVDHVRHCEQSGCVIVVAADSIPLRITAGHSGAGAIRSPITNVYSSIQRNDRVDRLEGIERALPGVQLLVRSGLNNDTDAVTAVRFCLVEGLVGDADQFVAIAVRPMAADYDAEAGGDIDQT